MAHLHAIETLTGNISDVRVEELAEGKALGIAAACVLHEVEGAELAKDLEKLLDLLLGEVRREAADEDLVRGVRDVGGNHAGNVDGGVALAGEGLVVLGAAELERVAVVIDAVKGHASGRLFRGSELMSRHNKWGGGGGGKTREMERLFEK